MVPVEKAREANFVITGPYSRWKEVMRKQLDPTRAMLTGKLKVKGDLTTLIRYTKAANEMTEATTRLDIEFPDEK
jgi:putative sterol carrier protein